MAAALAAGLAYFVIVFVVGFMLGTVRVLVLLRHLGELGTVLMELPIMLTVSWVVCRWLVDRCHVPNVWPHRLAMGSMAFGLLMSAELGMSVLAFGRSVADHLASYRAWPEAMGLAAQVVFAAIPSLQMRGRRHLAGSKRDAIG